MYYECFSPPWFFGYDILFSFLFMAVSLLIAAFAFDVYRNINQKNVRTFSLAFAFIALAYLCQALLNSYIYAHVKNGICDLFRLNSLSALSYAGITIHLLLMVIGLSVLAYTTLKTREPKILYIQLAGTLTALLFSKNITFTFFVLASVYFAIIGWHYIDNYFKNKNKKTLLIAIAFTILTLGWLDFLLVPYSPLFYVLSHVLQLTAFFLILWNFNLVRKR